jgi:TetR/AcrR family transcriptional repressor of nem operon
MNDISPQQSSDVRQGIIDTGQRIMSAKGFSAVGLSEILSAAGVPKGSFYYYFGSKEAFGEAILESYFEGYLAEIDETLQQPGLTMAERLMKYFQQWQDTQSFSNCQGKCLAVKLGAEVADLSETMRAAMERGTARISERLGRAIEIGVADGSISIEGDPYSVGKSLYQLWLGASVMVKISRSVEPFVGARSMTHQVLHVTH